MHPLLKLQLQKHFKMRIPDLPGMDDFLSDINNAFIEICKSASTQTIATKTRDETSEQAIASIGNIFEETSLIAILSNTGQIISLNKKLEELTGYKPESYQNKMPEELLGKKNYPVIAEAAARLQNGEIWQGDFSIVTSEGKTIWFNASSTPIFNEHHSISKILIVLNDITCRKQSEQALLQTKREYYSIINNIKGIIFQTDSNGKITFLNAAWKDLTGIDPGISLGCYLYDYMNPEVIPSIIKIYVDLADKGSERITITTKLNQRFTKDCLVEISFWSVPVPGEETYNVTGIILDITEESKKLELLSQTYSFQKAILDSARQGIITLTLGGHIQTINDGARVLLGIENDQNPATSHISTFINCPFIPSDETCFEETLYRELKSGSLETECSIKTMSGEYKDATFSLSIITDNSNQTTGFLLIVNDNTKRKNAEKELYRLNAIIEESSDYISYYDMNDNLLYANRAYRNLRQVQALKDEKNLYPEWADIIIKRKAIPHAIQNGSWKGETIIYDSYGKEIPVLQLILIHKDESGKTAFRSSIARDITYLKEYERKLLQSEKRNRDLVNYSQAIICTHDMSGTIISINPSGCRLLEYSQEELTGRNIAEFMPEDFRPMFQNEYLQTFSKNNHAEGILYLNSKSGKHISLLYKNYKVDEAGEESYVIGFAQDITERLIAEKELLAAKQAAEDSVKIKENFLANMSHEIRTPMNGIVGLTNLLIKTNLNAKQKEYAHSVKHNAENLLVVINDILDFSKIQAGKLEITKAPFELGSILYNLRQTFKIEAQRKNLELVTILDDRIPTLLNGDAIRINQVLVNLLGNALKFTSKGKVILSCQLIKYRKHACRVKFSVEDTGIGINNDKLENIFQSFTQANAETSRKYGGTGLGLTIVKDLLALMGSSIHVSSLPDKGSTFEFELNLETVSADVKITEDTEEDNFEGRLSGINILLAEDNKVNQLFASELLHEWGAQIDIADNGKIALELLSRNFYDLILMDIQMPEMGGIETTRIIRSELKSPRRDIRIIAMTANAMKGDEQKFKSEGMNDVIFKPFKATELFHVINKHIRLRSSIQNGIKNELVNNSHIPAQHEPAFQYINLKTLHDFSRGRKEFIAKMINVLLDSVPPTTADLDKAIQSGDWISASRYSHKLIPNMNMLGNAKLEQEMKWIENNSIDISSQEEIQKKWMHIKKELNLTINDLELANRFYNDKETKNLE